VRKYQSRQSQWAEAQYRIDDKGRQERRKLRLEDTLMIGHGHGTYRRRSDSMERWLATLEEREKALVSGQGRKIHPPCLNPTVTSGPA
jgi:hypothetical protein